MLTESALASAITKAIKANRGSVKKSNTSVSKINDDGTTTTKTEQLVDGPNDEPNAIGKAVAAEVIKALKSGITIEGMISDFMVVHSGTLVGAGGGPAPVAVTSGVVKSSVGKIKITMGKIT